MLKIIIISLFFYSSLVALPLKERMLAELDFVKGIFEIKYAPLKWKEQHVGFNLDEEMRSATQTIQHLQEPSLREYHRVLKRFFNQARDYHVGVRFYATEEASLPFLVKGAEGRYFVAHIDREILPYSKFPFAVGDEILEFDQKPIDEVIAWIKEEELGGNTEETDQALAELMLTNWRAEEGDLVPRGKVEITGRKKGETRERRVTLEWHYVPEKIEGFKPQLNVKPNFSKWRLNPKETIKTEKFFERLMIYSHWNSSHVGCFFSENKHSIGAKRSFIPPLGKKIWTAKKDGTFDAYTFRSPGGHLLGYIRIPHYMGDEEEVKEFCEIVKIFQEHTEALVIDQINNPGGSIFYAYALLAALVHEQPLITPKHHMMLTQEEVYMAISILDALEGVKDVKEAKEVIGETFEGYPVSMETVALLRDFCNFVLNEWSCGKLFTDPIHLFGVDEIKKHPDASYTKPILLLTNSLDFSCGDFFPAILQDSKRAKILGQRTAGAGGYVLGTQYPNQTAVLGFHLTGSMAERIGKRPIENLGIIPDIEYALTAYDLQNNYAKYVEKILAGVESLL